jgi:alpha-ketoglutaric semialdehyde dehydrogenase
MDLNFIGGKWTASRTGRTLLSINPATGETLGEVPRSDASDVQAAVTAAVDAFHAWRRVPAPRRGELLFRAGEMMLQRKEELARLMTMEMGKVLREARGDVQEGIDMTFYCAGEGRRLFGQTTQSELPNKFAMTVRDPVGVVAAITPWNFPLAIPTWKLMPALVCGNTVVFKPAEDTPLVACRLIEIMEEAGVPPGVLNMVHGTGEEAGDALVRHPDVNLVSFTGSTEVGRHVAVVSAQNDKRVSLEMGGKNAVIVMPDADMDLALEGIVWSAFGTSGQRCTAASRVIADHRIALDLADALAEMAARLRLGNGLEESTDVGPVINRTQLARIDSYAEIARREGARIVAGGAPAIEGDLARGAFYQPTVFADTTPEMRINQEEIFGPTTAVIPVGSLEEAIRVNNSTAYGLSTSIYTRDVNKAFQAIRDLTTGLVYVNAGTIGAEVHLPFGGTRGTGNGHREAGQPQFDIFTEWKSVSVDFSGKLQRAQIDLETSVG